MATDAPRISVIIAVRNGAATLERALASVFEQTHPDVELVVMDGASTDGSRAILERYANRITYWESQPDRGVYHAWNKALERATGDWICFLGADDEFAAPDTLAAIAAELVKLDPECRVAYGTLDVIGREGRAVRRVGTPWDPSAFREGMTLPHPATFHRRTLFDQHGSFDDTYRIAGDYEFLLRELLASRAHYIPLLTVRMRDGGISARPSSQPLLNLELHRALYAHGLGRVPAWRSAGVWRARARWQLQRAVGVRASDALVRVYRRARATARRTG